MPASNKHVMVQELRKIIRNGEEGTANRLKAMELLAEIDQRMPQRKRKKETVVVAVPSGVSQILEQLN